MRAGTACVMVGLGLLLAAARPWPPMMGWRSASSTPIRPSTGRSRRSTPAPATWRSPACSPRGAVTPHFNFLHRGEIPAGSGIGHHFHNTAEEMFVILGGEAQFTVDGRTSVVKGPAAVVCKQGHSHAIYNHSTQPLQWMNWQVGRHAERVRRVRSRRRPRRRAARSDPGVHDGAARSRPGAPGRRRPGRDHAAPVSAAGLHDAVDLRRSRAGRAGHDDAGQGARHDRRGLLRDRRQRAASRSAARARRSPPATRSPCASARRARIANAGAEPLELLVIGVARDLEAKTAFILANPPRRP